MENIFRLSHRSRRSSVVTLLLYLSENWPVWKFLRTVNASRWARSIAFKMYVDHLTQFNRPTERFQWTSWYYLLLICFTKIRQTSLSNTLFSSFQNWIYGAYIILFKCVCININTLYTGEYCNTYYLTVWKMPIELMPLLRYKCTILIHICNHVCK